MDLVGQLVCSGMKGQTMCPDPESGTLEEVLVVQ
jgi:hypothetical protein